MGKSHFLTGVDTSATEWGDSRSSEMPAVVSAQASRLEQVMQNAEDEGVDIVFIDTAPLSEATALAAARAVDLILIPCRPAILDLRAINPTTSPESISLIYYFT